MPAQAPPPPPPPPPRPTSPGSPHSLNSHDIKVYLETLPPPPPPPPGPPPARRRVLSQPQQNPFLSNHPQANDSSSCSSSSDDDDDDSSSSGSSASASSQVGNHAKESFGTNNDTTAAILPTSTSEPHYLLGSSGSGLSPQHKTSRPLRQEPIPEEEFPTTCEDATNNNMMWQQGSYETNNTQEYYGSDEEVASKTMHFPSVPPPFHHNHPNETTTTSAGTAARRNRTSHRSATQTAPTVPMPLPIPPNHSNPNTTTNNGKGFAAAQPSLEPYVGKLERFELFSTYQCYYLVACDKDSTTYRVLKMDRTLIERPDDDNNNDTNKSSTNNTPTYDNHGNNHSSFSNHNHNGNHSRSGGSGSNSGGPHGDGMGHNNNNSSSGPPNHNMNNNSGESSYNNNGMASSDGHQHNSKQTFRRLAEFMTEDPQVYNQEEIRDMLDMVHDGNRVQRRPASPEFGAPGSGGGGGHNHKNSTQGGGGAASGGLKPIAKAYGIVGFIRFLDCYYLTLITKRAKVGSIGGNGIYSIKSTETIPLKPAERSPNHATSHDNGNNNIDPSSMLLSMWNRGKRSVGLGLTNREIAELRYQGLYQVVDLTKNFYFSYTYDMTRSLQENCLAMTSQPFPPPPFKDMYAWNFSLTRELEECTSTLTSFHWVLPIVHGAYIQRKLNDYGRSLNLILIARRSRHFAGTRYLKRGVSDRGKVANDVEHEQIIHDESTVPTTTTTTTTAPTATEGSPAPPSSSASQSSYSSLSGTFSSYLQVRGSIPTYWTQESSVTMPKPPIELNRVDPTYHATRAHFEDLMKRYSHPVLVLDLVKQSEKREREVRVGNEYRHAIDYINSSIMGEDHKIRYCALDYSHISKHRNLNVSTSLNEVATWAVNQTGFFCSAPRWKICQGGRIEPFDETNSQSAAFLSHHLGVPVFPMEQKGVLRTNCIDCLDRTNVAQFSAGVEALGQQLVVMGIRSSARLDPSSNIVRMLIDLYVEIGDHIALQYGGSEAHKKVATAGNVNIPGPMGKHKELLTSIRRYYSNAFTDRLKQDAMNLFLGYYIPCRHTVPLWEMESDYYLHNFHVKAGSLKSMKAYKRAFAVDWSDDEDDAIGWSSRASTPLLTERKTIGHQSVPSRQSSESLMSLQHQQSFVSKRPGETESWRIERVRKRCKEQNEALSVWWRVAIQSYVQQRMWMQLGRGPNETFLPPRYERIYQPHKMAQFDKFFSRTWAKPMRLSHSAQHTEDPDEKTNSYQKTASPTKVKSYLFNEKNKSELCSGDELLSQDDHNDEEKLDDDDIGSNGDDTIQEFISLHGFNARKAPSLANFISPHDVCNQDFDEHYFAKEDEIWPHAGSLRKTKKPCPKYVQYAKYSRQPASFSKEFRQEAVDEFTKCLEETMLDSNDVKGIRKLAESAHIGREIQTGPYTGLSHDVSALTLCTVMQDQFDILESKRERKVLNRGGDMNDVLPELRRHGFDSSGTREAVTAGFNRMAKAEEAYAEILDTRSLGCRRSDLTSEKSMQLYCSFFEESMPVSRLDTTYILGEEKSADSSTAKKRASRSTNRHRDGSRKTEELSSFAAKAAELGISISSRTSVLKQPSKEQPSLFSLDVQSVPPAGFEQINEDMFARKDNKFMVFNESGVHTWIEHQNGSPAQQQPITKLQGIDQDFVLE